MRVWRLYAFLSWDILEKVKLITQHKWANIVVPAFHIIQNAASSHTRLVTVCRDFTKVTDNTGLFFKDHFTFGIKVSHSHRRSNRTWKPNVRKVRAIVNGTPKSVHVCTRCLRSGKVTRAVWKKNICRGWPCFFFLKI